MEICSTLSYSWTRLFTIHIGGATMAVEQVRNTTTSDTTGAGVQKRPYSPPVLRAYGTVETLTQGTGTSGTDAGGGTVNNSV